MIEAWLDDLAATTSADTYRHHRSVILRAEPELPAGVVAAAPHELHAWLYSRPEWTPGTRASYLDAFRSLHGWLRARDVTSYDPAALVDNVRVPRRLPWPVTDDELGRILVEAPPRVRFWSRLAAYLGLRRIEIARLDRRDVTEQEVRVRAGKGDHQRIVPCHPAAWEVLADLPLGPVAPVAPDVITHASGRAYRALGIDGSIHRCRHWYASKALEVCGDIRVVQELLGHASVATTQIYTAVTSDARRAAVAGLPAIGSAGAAAAGSPVARPASPPAGAAGPRADESTTG